MNTTIAAADVLLVPMTRPRSDAAAFAGLVHGLYLSIFHPLSAFSSQFVHPDGSLKTLLDQRIERLIFTDGLEFLEHSSDRMVQDVAKRYSTVSQSGFARTFAVSDLIMLSIRCLASDTTRELLDWVIIAYGASLPRSAMLGLYGVQPCGSLYPLGRMVGVVDTEHADHHHRPPFWRWLMTVTRSYVGAPDALMQLCDAVLCRVALPSYPVMGKCYNDVYALPSLVRMLSTLQMMTDEQAYMQQPVMRRTALQVYATTRLVTNKQSVFIVAGSEHFLDWISVFSNQQMGCCFVQDCLMGALASPDNSVRLFDNNRSGLQSVRLLSSMEAFKAKTKDDDKETEEEPDAYDEGATDDTSDTVGNGLTNQDPNDPAVQGDADHAMDALPDPKTDDNIDLISLHRDTGSVNAYLYKRAVLALMTTLEQNPDLTISQDARDSLKDWCQNWMWLAHVTQTQKLVRELGLQSILKPVNKIKGI